MRRVLAGPPRWDALKDVLLACALSSAFLVLSYLRTLGGVQSAAFTSEVVDPAVLRLSGTAFAANLRQFAVTLLALHLTVGMLCLAAAHVSRFAWRSQTTRRHWLILWFIAAVVWLMVANSTWFPFTQMGEAYAHAAQREWHGVRLLEVFTALILLGTIVTCGRALARLGAGAASKALIAGVMLVLILAVCAWLPAVKMEHAPAASLAGKPNIIVLGMDSLRFDALGKGNTPAIDRFLSESVVFTDTLTPIARTFPSWVAIITGRHPHTTGATTNLMPRYLVQEGETLPEMLRGVGYSSLYAIDESRFSNLDATFGFDVAVTPLMGATDFVMSFIADVPLSNVLTNTPVGRLLLPYGYANRGMPATYDPDEFLKRLEPLLPTRAPVLIATHLTLAHAPYVWADQKSIPSAPDGSTSVPAMYELAVARVDRQFAGLIDMLTRKGLLDNAVVFVLSDHGESVGEPCITIANERSGNGPASPDCKVFGHGNSVFAKDQHQVVLGVRSFGDSANFDLRPRRMPVPASLEDITPTIAELVKVPAPPFFDGQSLLPLLQATSDSSAFQGRVRFAETEFNPSGFDGTAFRSHSAMRLASSYYQVDPVTDRITIREVEVPAIVMNRQRAAIKCGHMLVADPAGAGGFKLVHVSPDAPARLIAKQAALQSDPLLAELWAALLRRFPELQDTVNFKEDPAPAKFGQVFDPTVEMRLCIDPRMPAADQTA